MRRALGPATALTLLLAAPAAQAQRWVASGLAEASSGIEGGGGRDSTMTRAPTRMRLGADLAVDEDPANVFGAAVLLAIEPRTAFGVDARYTRVVGERFAFSAGAAMYFQPGSLFGPLAAAEYRHPLSKMFVFTVGPEADVFVLGSDLPDRTVLWQALFKVGVRASF